MLNEVRLIGRLTKDAEKREIKDKGAFLNFSIAVNESYKKDGQWQERTDYFDVEMFVKNPENLEKKLKKGNQVLVIGKLRQNIWEDKEGNKHSKVKVQAQRVVLLKSVEATTSEEVAEDIDAEDIEEEGVEF